MCIDFPLLEIAASFLKESSAGKNAPSIFLRSLQFGIFKERLEPVTQLSLCMNHNRTVCGETA